jgi:hypothetical protein
MQLELEFPNVMVIAEQKLLSPDGTADRRAQAECGQ